MKVDAGPVRHISIHPSSQLALLTCCLLHINNNNIITIYTADRAVLVDLDTFSHVRTLHGAEGVGLQHAMFLPSGETIITCFRDDTVMAWSTTSLSVREDRSEFHLDPRMTQAKVTLPLPPKAHPLPHLRAFASSRNSKVFVAGGKGRYGHYYTMLPS